MNQTVLNRSRNDKFIMVLDLPLAMKSINDSILGTNFSINPLQFSIYGSPVPQITVPDINLPFGGQVHKISSNSRPAYNPLTIKFLVDNGYKNYWILWNWLNLFNDSKSSTSNITEAYNTPIYDNKLPVLKNAVNKYTSQFSIFSLDEFNNKIVSFTYTNAFPTALGEINFSNQDPSEINCTVTFAFNQLNVDLLKNVDQVTC
jgi:hypothetical protein